MRSKMFRVALVISILLNLILAAFAYQLQGKFSIEKTKSISIQATSGETASAYPQTEDTSWMNPVPLYYDDSCLLKSAKCADFGQAQIGFDGLNGEQLVNARIFPIANDNESVNVRFFMGAKEWVIPPFKMASNLRIWYLQGRSMYIEELPIHEGVSQYFVYHLGSKQANWEKFDPWSYVKGEFPDTMEPPFSLEVGPSYLRLTEENYCCDTLHSDTPNRNANRMVYVLRQGYDNDSQPSLTIVDRGTVPR